MSRFIAACVVVALSFQYAATLNAATQSGKPNIIIIFNDDMGYADLGCFGAPKHKTPRIDRMAREGRRFTSFYVASSVCSASRAALLTGCYPNRVGVPGVFFPNRGSHGLEPEHFTIAELLKSVGYKTLAAGKWHLGDEPQFLPTNQGFDSFYGVPYSNDMYPARNMKYADDCLYREDITPEKIEAAFAAAPEGKQPGTMRHKVPLMRDEECIEFPLDQTTITRRLADESIRFIEQSVKQRRPFFLYLANPMPHVPLFVSPEFEGKSAGGLYGDVIEEIDFNTGRVLDALQANGVDEDTLVIFTSDNGPWLIKGEHGGSAKPFRDGKGSSYEGGQRVPCVMRWPAKLPAGTECKEVVTAMDLLPTFAELTGAKMPPDLKLKPDGHDIQNLMLGGPEAETPYDRFFFSNNQAVRTGNWKYRHGHRYGNWSGVRDKPNPKERQLFNLADDLGEANNVIEEHAELAERLTALLSQSPNQTMVLFDPAPPAGTRYELETGEVSGGANAGTRHVGNMQSPGAAIAISVDGGSGGGEFQLVLGIRYDNDCVASSDFEAVIPSKLGNAVATDTKSDALPGGADRWSHAAPAEGVGGISGFRPINNRRGTNSDQFSDPKWKAPHASDLTFKFYCTQPQTLLLSANGRYVTEIEITASDQWQNMTVKASQLKHPAGFALGDWSEVKNIGFKPKQGSDITKVVLARFEWKVPQRKIPEPSKDGKTYLTIEAAGFTESFWRVLNDKGVEGKPLSVGGKKFERGLGVHANSKICFPLNGTFATFHVVPGPDDSHRGLLEMKILVDGKEVFASGKVRSAGFEAQPVTLPVTGAKELTLVVTDAGDGKGGDHASWADAHLTAVK